MGHVFTVTFPFQYKEYTAIVILKYGQPQQSMQIQLTDPALHYLIPNGLLTYSEEDGLNLKVERHRQLTYTLLSSLVNAVEERLFVGAFEP